MPRYFNTPANFPCGQCGGKTTVTDSRPMSEGVRRRRECFSCRQRFTTWEMRGEEPNELIVSLGSKRTQRLTDRIEALRETMDRFLKGLPE